MTAAKKKKSGDSALLPHIAKLLSHQDASRRSAAAIVLGELGSDEPTVLNELRGALKRSDDVTLRRRATEALGAIGPKTIVKDLRPLLKDPETSVRDMARHVLATSDAIDAADIATMLDSKDDKQKLGAIAVLGARGGAEERKRLLLQLEAGNSRTQDAVNEALLPLLPKLAGGEADDFLSQLEELMSPTKTEVDPKLAGHLIKLVSAMKNEAVGRLLLKIAQQRGAPEVQASAIEALRRVERPKKVDQAIFKFLLEMVEAEDTPPKIVSTAIDTLAGIDMPLALEPRVRSLVGVEQAAVRRWALKALGALDSAPAGKALALAAQNGDATDREIAIEAALATHNGRAALAKALASMTDADRAQKIASGLRRHANDLQQSTLHTLEEAVIDADPAISSLIIELLRHCGGADRVQSTLFDKALDMKKKANYIDAAELFKRLCAGQNGDAEARFQLGVCELKMSKRALSRGPKNDPCLQTFSVLIKTRDFPIVQRLSAEKGLGAEELYYLGFSLAEGSGNGQGLGGDILTSIWETSEDSKLKRMAKNKLVTMGWLE